MYGELQALSGLPDIAALTAGATEMNGSAETTAIVLGLSCDDIASGKENGTHAIANCDHPIPDTRLVISKLDVSKIIGTFYLEQR